ncbi:hypothetical protein SAMN05428981_107110 [Bacillus sp. OV194]|nr:hypothetical protein SAMN05428981_107110 [Bacillus sp. OV194]
MSGTVSVLTYENPNNFHQKQEFQPYNNSPHICATRSLTLGVRENAELSKVKSIGELMDFFFPGWNLPENRFIQYSQLSDILRSWDGVHHPKVIQSFKRNKLNLLITMRNLTELGLSPNLLLPKCKKIEEKLFCDIWQVMMPNFEHYMEKSPIRNLQQVRDVFAEAGIPIVDDTVILHGFYFISPVQHHIFTKWKQLGLNIVFLNLYDTAYPSVFSFLDENFSEKNGWASRDDWTIIKDMETMAGHHFAAHFDETSYPERELHAVKEKPYDYMVEFVEDIKDGSHYVSPNTDELKARIKEFRPGSFQGDRHFLAYPIGQYLFHLHSIWNEEKSDYFLTDKVLMECFASGWLQVGEENARQYTGQLKAILPYFKNCQTLEEWILQFKKLLNAKASSSQILKGYELRDEDYLEAVRISPVLRFSYFSVPLHVLKRLLVFFEKLVENAKWLVNIEEERVTIKTHFNRIKKLIDDSNLKSSLSDTVESKLVEHLEEILMKPIEDEQSYHIGDLSDAIIVFLKNGLEDTSGEETTLDNKQEGNVFIYNMEDLDGLILRRDVRELNICGMDEHHFPRTNIPMPWPLSLELITSLDNRSTDMYLFRKNNSLAFSKYLFFVALCFQGEIHFSWVKNWNEYENLDKSIYLQLLNIGSKLEWDEECYTYKTSTVVPNELEVSKVQERLDLLPHEEISEMNLCKRRFFYSTVAERFSTYQSLFHQEFLIGNLAKIYSAKGKSKAEIIEMLEILFPFLSRIRLRTIVEQNLNEDYVSGMRRYGLGRRRRFNGIDYPESTTYFQFLTHKGAFQNELWKSSFQPVQGKKKLKADMIQQITSSRSSILPEANPSELCKLCPHSEYCEEAYFAVDIPKRGFDDNDKDAAGA